MREQLIIGEPRARGRLGGDVFQRLRVMRGVQRLGPVRPAVAVLERWIDPFGHAIGHTGQRRGHGAGDPLLRHARGERIDRFKRGDLAGLVRQDDVFGVDDLGDPVEQLGPA